MVSHWPRWRRFRAVGLRSIVIGCIGALPAAAQFDPTFLESQVVRVIVVGAGAASGFLWQTPDQVVTSLHALRPGAAVSVQCLGITRPAEVVKVFRKADLALLRVSGLDACRPFSEVEERKPVPNTELHTFGFHAAARGGTSRRFNKGYAAEETLQGLVAEGPALNALKSLGMPAIDLDIYYVEGGLLPGYSGAPVVDGSRRLVGIVDGGLDKGQSQYNWVIPAAYLRNLLASTETQVPSGLTASGQHFSSGPLEAEASAVLEYDQGSFHYRWVQTKTRSLADLARTSDDPEGVSELIELYGSVLGDDGAAQLEFDVYEDQEQGLVIALPAGQALKFEQVSPQYPDRYWLISEAEADSGDAYDGHLQFEQVEGAFAVGDELIGIHDPRYFEQVIAGLLEECASFDSTCKIDPNLAYEIEFENGSKILRVGFFVDYHNDSIDAYDYYSYAVPAGGDAAFRAYGRFWPGEDGLFACAQDAACNPALATKQLSQMVSVHLTTFAGMSAPVADDNEARQVSVFNTSDRFTITSVHASNAGANEWSENLLGAGIPPEDFININLADANGVCKLDFKAVYDDGAEQITENVEVCEGFPGSSAFFFRLNE